MRRQSREWRNALIAVAIAFAVAFTLMGIAHPAWAHDDAQWIQEQQLKNRQGEYCCGVSDCMAVDRTTYTESSGGYVITHPLTKNVETVPYSEAMPFSIDGRLWICRKGDGTRRCVFNQIPGM